MFLEGSLRSFSGYKNFRSLKITLQGTLTYPLPAGTGRQGTMTNSGPIWAKDVQVTWGMKLEAPQRIHEMDGSWYYIGRVTWGYNSLWFHIFDGYHVCARLFTFIYTVVRAQTETWREGRHSMILAQKSQKSTKMTYKTNRLHPFGVRYCHYLKRTHLPKLPWGLAASLGLWVWLEWLAIVRLENGSFCSSFVVSSFPFGALLSIFTIF